MKQDSQRWNQGFTLVEIMIVIVIIILLTQLWSIGEFFRAQDRSKLEQVTIQMLSTIDETKTNALLGKTEGGQIVRKRITIIQPENPLGSVIIKTGYNLDSESATASPNMLQTKNWSLPELQTTFFGCDGVATGTILNGLSDVHIIFKQDTLSFETSTLPAPSSFPHHLVILVQTGENAREIHIDNRTWLTYDRPAKSTVPWSFEVACN